MGFYIAESTLTGEFFAGTERELVPGPSYPDYTAAADRFEYTLHKSDSGAVVQQRARGGGAELKWIWQNHGPNVPGYEDLYWDVLFSSQVHVRKMMGKSPYVFLKEDVSGNLGVYDPITREGTADWVRCLVYYAGRTERQQGGPVLFDITELRFVIADPRVREWI